MLLDQIFQPDSPKEIVFVRKDGKLSQIARKIVAKPTHDSSDKPLFPISKERT